MPRKVLILVDWYIPGNKAGGPIQSCVNLVHHLKEHYDFAVVTTDRDLGAEEPYPNIKIDEWNILENGTRVYYTSPSKLGILNIYRIIKKEKPDTIYINSMFSLAFTIYPLLLRKLLSLKAKTVVASRGMLAKGALALKNKKKKTFLNAAKLINLYKNVTWHASTDLEKQEIIDVFGENVEIIVARNFTAPRELEYRTRPKLKNVLKIVFLGRISVIKNLYEAIEYLKHTDTDKKIEFDIYGPVEEKEYWTKCLDLIVELDDHIKCTYKGVVSRDDVMETLSSYHVMLLPTRRENFGHAIVESFVASCPVIISNRTPWRNLMEVKAGFDISLDEASTFTQAINKIAAMEGDEYNEWSKGAFKFAEGIVYNEEVLQQNKMLFE